MAARNRLESAFREIKERIKKDSDELRVMMFRYESEKSKLVTELVNCEAKYDDLPNENRIRSNENKKLCGEMEPADILDFFHNLEFAFAENDTEHIKIRALAQLCPSSLIRAIDFNLSYENTKLLVMNLMVPKMSDRPRLREELDEMKRNAGESILPFVKRIDAHVYMLNPHQSATERVATVVEECTGKASAYVQIKMTDRPKNFASIFDFVTYAQKVEAVISAEKKFLRRK